MSQSTEGHVAKDVRVGEEVALDPRLSARSKGLYLMLTALADQSVNVAEIARRSADGEASVKRGLLDLAAAGYLTREVVRGEGGRMSGIRYVVHARPRGEQGDQQSA